MSRLLCSALLTATLFACDRSAPAPAPNPGPPAAPARAAPTPTPVPAPQPPAAAPFPAPADASADASPGGPRQLSHALLQKRGCTKLDELTLSASAHQVFVPTQDSKLEALIVRDDRKTLEWWSGELGGPAAARAARTLSTRVAKLSLLRRASASYAVALVDEQGSVWSIQYSAGAWSEPKLIAKMADRRFAPALYEDGAISLLAYTSSVKDVMHTFVARSQVGPGADVTPQGHGAAAPTFVRGVRDPILVFVDARDGVSPLLEVGFDAELKPLPAVVRTPISQPYAPPLLRAVAIEGGETEVAFTAVGKLAATAIGRVPLRRAVPAVALHPSRGYGELSFDAALSGRAAIFALEVPLDEKPDAAHVLEIKWLDASGEGGTLNLAQDRALRPSIAATPLPGELLVGYVTGSTPHIARLRCDAG